MLPDEKPMSELALRQKIGESRGQKEINYQTLKRAVRELGLPQHKDLFGPGWIYYWSEVQAWMVAKDAELSPKLILPPPVRLRGRGRPRKTEPVLASSGLPHPPQKRGRPRKTALAGDEVESLAVEGASTSKGLASRPIQDLMAGEAH